MGENKDVILLKLATFYILDVRLILYHSYMSEYINHR